MRLGWTSGTSMHICVSILEYFGDAHTFAVSYKWHRAWCKVHSVFKSQFVFVILEELNQLYDVLCFQ